MEQELIRLSKSVIGSEEKRAVMGVLDREYLGMGKEVKEFEDALTSFFHRQALCVNTGTAAIHLALQALGIGRGDEVLVQSLTYLATFQAISATGAKPIPCDINPETITIDVNDARKRITEKTKAIVPVHYASGMGTLDKVYDLAADNGLRVVEDAAHAFGCYYKGRKVGSFGDIACFSLVGTKNITSGEGGIIVTDDEQVIQRASDARLLGVEGDAQKRYVGDRSYDFDVKYQGWRYHMSNIMAAIGIEQLKKLPEFSMVRKSIARRYRGHLGHIDSIELLKQDINSIIPHIFVVKLKNINRDRVREKLLRQGIQAGVHYFPNHLLSLYMNNTTLPLPVTEEIYPELLTLPLHPDLSDSDVDYICEQLIECIEDER